jgi:hypothetical protein
MIFALPTAEARQNVSAFDTAETLPSRTQQHTIIVTESVFVKTTM